MRPARALPDGTVEVMDALLSGDLSVWQRRRATGIRLLALGRTNLDVAEIVGKHKNTVAEWRSQYLAHGVESIARTPGGRRNELMDQDAERAFVDAFRDAAERGEIVTVSVIIEELSKRVGHAVWPSTVYRLLERHGWRKLAPRPSHPKADPVARAAFKQTSPRSSPARS